MNSEEVKAKAREFGADLVGIAPVARLAYLAPERRPATLLPTARSVIVVGHRILRGALRGVEEGTNFGSTYLCYGFDWPEKSFLSRTVYRLACFLEEAGLLSVPQAAFREPGSAGPLPDLGAAARAAGLGCRGKGGFFLTPQYGHRQRFGLVVTEAELEPDPEFTGDLCGDCRACLDGCPLNAISKHAVNFELCRRCRNGAVAEPHFPDGVDRYAAACGRACLAAMEPRLGNRFANPFRKRRVWSIGLEDDGSTPDCANHGGMARRYDKEK